ncbi:MAG: hypothetical protein ACI8XX_001609 [Polaribacter sp.]|jgi:hypothetical protein
MSKSSPEFQHPHNYRKHSTQFCAVRKIAQCCGRYNFKGLKVKLQRFQIK